MDRIRELINCVRSRFPGDDFFSNFEESCEIPTKKNFYQEYEKVLRVLDDESWKNLRGKALRHFMNHRECQKKQGFFNILNEAFAYQYLLNKGYENVRFVEESRKKSPDIEFIVNNKKRFCEVKTSNISDDEISRRGKDFVVFDTYDEYGNLNDLFFVNKLLNIINKAEEQLKEFGINNIIFLIIIFDDFTLEYIQTYKRKLISFLKKNEYNNLIIKIGLDSEEYLLKNFDQK